MKNKIITVKLIKSNIEYLISILEITEDYFNDKKNPLLRNSIVLVDGAINGYVKEQTTENLNWIEEGLRTILRHYPEMIIKTNSEHINNDTNRLFSILNNLLREL